MFSASRFDGAKSKTAGSYQTASVNPKGYSLSSGFDSAPTRTNDGREHDVKGNTSNSGKGTAQLNGGRGDIGIG